MASLIYDIFFYNLGSANVNWTSGGDTYKVALVSSSYVSIANKKHKYWSASDTVSSPFNFEVTGTAYVTGGQIMTSMADSMGRSNGDTIILDSADVTWSSSTVTAAGAVIYDARLANKSLVAFFDFSGNQSSTGGDFTLQWSPTGIFNFYQG
jgi:hypothetical protein